MAVISADRSRTFVRGGATFTTLVAPSTGARETSAWRLSLAPGAVGAPHHLTREELFLATAGIAVATLDGVEHELQAGDALVLAAGVTLVLANHADVPFEAVAILPVGAEAVTEDGVAFVPPWAA